VDDPYEKQRQTAGSWATLVWLASGLSLYLTSESATLFSWSALVFLAVGMFAAAIVFGIAFYLVQRAIAKALMIFVSTPTPGVATAIRSIGFVLLLLEAVLIYLVASWIFHSVPFLHS